VDAHGKVLYAIDTYCYDYCLLNVALDRGGCDVLLLRPQALDGRAAQPRGCGAAHVAQSSRSALPLLIVSLSALLDSGLTLSAALKRIARHTDPWLRWHVSTMETPQGASRAADARVRDGHFLGRWSTGSPMRSDATTSWTPSSRSAARRSIAWSSGAPQCADHPLRAARRCAALFIGLGVGSCVVTGVTSFRRAERDLRQ
jgi:hypothetical protein